MAFNRIRISTDTTNKLRILKARTGLTPNILSRLALCFSLNEESPPILPATDDNGQEFNRFTLTGEWDSFFIALVKEKYKNKNLESEKDLAQLFKAHIERGVLSLYSRVKDIGDLNILLPNNYKINSSKNTDENAN